MPEITTKDHIWRMVRLEENESLSNYHYLQMYRHTANGQAVSSLATFQTNEHAATNDTPTTPHPSTPPLQAHTQHPHPEQPEPPDPQEPELARIVTTAFVLHRAQQRYFASYMTSLQREFPGAFIPDGAVLQAWLHAASQAVSLLANYFVQSDIQSDTLPRAPEHRSKRIRYENEGLNRMQDEGPSEVPGGIPVRITHEIMDEFLNRVSNEVPNEVPREVPGGIPVRNTNAIMNDFLNRISNEVPVPNEVPNT